VLKAQLDVLEARFKREEAGVKPRPKRPLVHDHGSHFAGQFERWLRVLKIEQVRTVTGLRPLLVHVDQGSDGRAPAEFSESVPEVPVLRPDEIGQRRLLQREYASGILRGYSLVPAATAGPDALAA